MNRLSGETSPYLRQHRENPVDWFPWGQEAFDEARRRDVPVLLSVGYSACHWCHVMAHECFEDDEVARAMNERFVNIKVDREERPDVDSVYMDAVVALTGRGGWPLTAVLDHDGRPFWGGTYYPKPAFLKLIDALTDVWENRREDLDANATALVQAIGASSSVTPTEGLPSLETVNDVLGRLASAFDDEWGGFGQAPKFPSTFHLELIMRAYMTSGGDGPRDVTTTTLDAMASGGMYDHLGGGFARYSVDRQWLVPHFEKMLYDQALLIRAYRQGWSLFRRDDWRLVVEETVGYVLGTLRDPAGGIHSAEDADSPAPDGTSVEGWFYTWTERCSARRPRSPWSGSASPSLATSRVAASRIDSITVGSSSGPPRWNGCASAFSRPGHHAPDRAATTRCSPSGTPSSSPRCSTPQPPWNVPTGWSPPRRSDSSSCARCAPRTAAGCGPGRPRVSPGRDMEPSPPITPRSSTPSPASARRPAAPSGRDSPSRPPTPCSTTSGTRSTAGSSPPPTMPSNSWFDRRISTTRRSLQ
ncbi:MAG: DUF255 domain-containing protein, partial [Ilumatobacteraceae bacterium]